MAVAERKKKTPCYGVFPRQALRRIPKKSRGAISADVTTKHKAYPAQWSIAAVVKAAGRVPMSSALRSGGKARPPRSGVAPCLQEIAAGKHGRIRCRIGCCGARGVRCFVRTRLLLLLAYYSAPACSAAEGCAVGVPKAAQRGAPHAEGCAVGVPKAGRSPALSVIILLKVVFFGKKNIFFHKKSTESRKLFPKKYTVHVVCSFYVHF